MQWFENHYTTTHEFSVFENHYTTTHEFSDFENHYTNSQTTTPVFENHYTNSQTTTSVFENHYTTTHEFSLFENHYTTTHEFSVFKNHYTTTHEFSDFENHYTNSTNSRSTLCALMSIKMGFDGVWKKFDFRRAFIYFYKKKTREISTKNYHITFNCTLELLC